ncbi:MAG: hypothetical protein RIC55_33030 [Pirellulaceae bacterium]
MDFDKRLQDAVQRGKRRSDEKAQEAAARALSEEELKSLHSRYRLSLSEHIEDCLKQLPNHFPGFRSETIYGERGWGGACYRDDIRIRDGRRDNDYSRLEMTIRPYSSYNVLELAAKGTIGNKEVFNRSHFEELGEVDPQRFVELIDVWVLEYAELYAAKQ